MSNKALIVTNVLLIGVVVYVIIQLNETKKAVGKLDPVFDTVNRINDPINRILQGFGL